MKHQSRLTSQQQQEETQTHDQAQTQAHQQLEFATPESMLRHDALRTPVPPAIEFRLQDSLAKKSVSSPAPWWKRLFGS